MEALRQIGLSKRALEVEVVHRLLFNILDPVQAAKFLTWIRVIVVLPISQWKEWMRLIYPCILGADWSVILPLSLPLSVPLSLSLPALFRISSI